MSKENMTMDEAYTCPRCGGQAVNVGAMEQIFSDARSEEISCMKCGSTWMVYYKMSDFNTKTLNITDTPLEDSVSVAADGTLIDALSADPVEETIELASEEVADVEDYHVVSEDGTKPGITTEDNQ